MRKLVNGIGRFCFHPNIARRTLTTFIYCTIGILLNFYAFQVFCRPVTYAANLCIAFYLAILILPFIKNKIIKIPFYFILGTGIPICLYCMIFIYDPWGGLNAFLGNLFIAFIFFLGLGIFAFIPVYLLYNIYKYFREAGKLGRTLVIVGCLTPLIILSIYLAQFKTNYNRYMNAYKKYGNTDSFANAIPANYFTERFLGIGFKYHTKLSLYDGWRPPLNDPFINIGLWIYGKSYYTPPVSPYYYYTNLRPGSNYQHFNPTLYHKIKFYHQLFPKLPIRANCPCSYTRDGLSYFND